MDEFEHLGEEVDIGGDHEAVATSVGDDADAADEVTDGAGGATAVE
ncbi:MAG: hypothetical protein RI897_3957 [Verrucomicrobiota bacterium]